MDVAFLTSPEQTVLFAWNVRLALRGANAQMNSDQRNKAECCKSHQTSSSPPRLLGAKMQFSSANWLCIGGGLPQLQRQGAVNLTRHYCLSKVYKREEDSKAGELEVRRRLPRPFACRIDLAMWPNPSRIRHAGGRGGRLVRPYRSRRQRDEREEEGSLAKLHLRRGPTSPCPVLGTQQMASGINETMRMALTCVIVKRRDSEMPEKEIYQEAVVLCLSPPRSKYAAPTAASDANAISPLKPSLLATFVFL